MIPILSDDPQAAEKLEARIRALEEKQVKMAAANQLLRRGDEASLPALGFDPAQCLRLTTPDHAGRRGFAPFQLHNNRSNILRLKARLAEVKSRRKTKRPRGTKSMDEANLNVQNHASDPDRGPGGLD